jgi:hypothetical protein
MGRMEDTKRWPDGCGAGRWCERCRQEIREEALLWLHELNVLPQASAPSMAPVISTRWHRKWLLTHR